MREREGEERERDKVQVGWGEWEWASMARKLFSSVLRFYSHAY